MLTRIINWIKTLVHINRMLGETERKLNALDSKSDNLNGRLDNLNGRLDNLNGRIHDMDESVNAHEWHLSRMRDALSDVEYILSDAEKLKHLKSKLSGAPAIWGDESRLEISEKAAVYPALFNTNSGQIFIGDYTFAGSNVSFITGSHDMKLTGVLRRDCEIKEGNDIHIGKGVWIASNATILGPCEIEDDAVIAAGAVVIPGTRVHKGEVYGGIPAKKISKIQPEEMSLENGSVRNALERENGVLFMDGWSDKRVLEGEGDRHLGHYLFGKSASLITDRSKLKLYFAVEDEDPSMTIAVEGEKYELTRGSGYIKHDVSSPVVEIVKGSDKKLFIGIQYSDPLNKENV